MSFSTSNKTEPIVYSLISRGKTVLAEHTFTTGNFTTITRVLLNKIKDHDSRQSIQYDDYVFHIVVEDRVTYLCMSEDKKSVHVSFQFLDDVKKKFQERYKEKIHTAIAFQMDADFKRVLERQMLYYNNPDNNTTARLSSKLDDVKGIMLQNVETVLGRGEKLDILVDKSERLTNQAQTFKKTTTSLANKMWYQKMRCYFYGFLVICVLGWAASSFICGFNYSKCMHKK